MARNVNKNELPMLASASTGASNRAPIDVRTLISTGGWVLDTKLDGVRAFWREGHLVNRRGVDITHKFPEISLPGDLWLDGEIVAHDNLFETVAQRDKLERAVQIRRGAEANPCTFVAFDMPARATLGWVDRREQLEIHSGNGDQFAVTPVSYDVDYIDRVRAAGMEGVIAKQISSRYQFGKRSPQWIKHKFTHRISCLIKGYEPGNGSRGHLGAIYLTLFDHVNTELVPVGRCGSGFTDKQTHDLKVRLDNGEILVAEIEALNLTSGGTLRFPVFRGIRTDVSPLECTVDQLDTLPRSGKTDTRDWLHS